MFRFSFADTVVLMAKGSRLACSLFLAMVLRNYSWNTVFHGEPPTSWTI